MTKTFSIMHLSDLHFGRIHPATLEHLEEFISQRREEIKLAIVTGDLTQRAKKEEFIAAKEFISSLNAPLFVVPGNHDVPLYNLLLRFLSPYKKFLRYLGPFAQNYFEDDHIAVFGLWTVDSFAVQTGRIRSKDLLEIEEKFKNVPAHKIKIVACHHPLFSIAHPRIKKDIKRLTELNPHFFMWGHEHQSAVSQVNESTLFPLVLASGTTTSTRTRKETNSFNYMTFFEDHFDVEIYRHSKLLNAFEVIDRHTYDLLPGRFLSS